MRASLRPCFVLLIALLAGCGRTSLMVGVEEQGPDDGAVDLGGAVFDLASAPDIGDQPGPGPDLAVPFALPDLAVTQDLATLADVGAVIDLAAPPDLAVTRDIAAPVDLAVAPPDFLDVDLTGVDLTEPVLDFAGTDGVPPDLSHPDGGRADLLAPVCGNGVVEQGEQCDDGMKNADSPAFMVTEPGTNVAFAATPVDSLASAVAFYNLTNNNANTGFEVAQRSELFLYRDATNDTFSLFTITNAAGGGGFGFVTMNLSNLPPATMVVVADKRANEFAKASPTTVNAVWFWAGGGTSGGVLSDFPVPSAWDTTVTPNFLFGANAWVWVDRNGVIIPLQSNTTLNIIATAMPSPCRKDCTIPRCGDGILDAGELCDHGAQNGVDGLCGKNCK